MISKLAVVLIVGIVISVGDEIDTDVKTLHSNQIPHNSFESNQRNLLWSWSKRYYNDDHDSYGNEQYWNWKKKYNTYTYDNDDSSSDSDGSNNKYWRWRKKYSDSSSDGKDFNPTHRPTPKPTTNITPEPTLPPIDPVTNQPTDQPNDNPTTNPTDQPTQQPTQQPTDQPTDSPSSQPTEPKQEFCEELKYTRSDIIILVDNGCVITEDECFVQNQFLLSLVERIFAPLARVSIINYNQDLEFINIDFGELEDYDSEKTNALEIIPNIKCNQGSIVPKTNIGPAIEGAIDIFENNSPDNVQKRLIILSYCDATDLKYNDEICDEFKRDLEKNNIITYVVNLGIQIEYDAYKCLTPDFASDEFIDNIDFIDLDKLIPDLRDDIVDKVCSVITPEPTRNPTDKPTNQPTSKKSSKKSSKIVNRY